MSAVLELAGWLLELPLAHDIWAVHRESLPQDDAAGGGSSAIVIAISLVLLLVATGALLWLKRRQERVER